MTLSIPDSRVFEWLGNNDRGTPYYLQALNLSWDGDEQIEAAMKQFIEVAKRLQAEPHYWSGILRTKDWRPTLVGCTCILVSRNHNYFQDLEFSFQQGSWVSPQIAVTMGIAHPDLAHKFFKEYLSSIVPEQNAKKFTSAQCVLTKLDASSCVNEFEWNSQWDRDDSNIAKSVVEHHWKFWSHFSYTRCSSY
jgi:hypothetical protein